MKSLRIITIALALAVVAGVAAARPASAAVSFDFFYSNLSPHGHWLASGSYGRVWQPAEYRTGWNPYYDGHWQYTDAGWCWDSDYEWGDIPYHYGTWVDDDESGWVWVPGYTYAPSWVEFREGPDYIGWGPVAPSFSIGVSFGHVFRPNDFVFVHSHDFLCDRVRSYAVPRRDVNIIVNRTKIINNNIRIENNVVVNRGPDVRFVERATNRRINAVSIDRVRSVQRLDARGVSRQDLRVDSRSDRRGVRAAEPFSASRPLPNRGNDRNGSDRNGSDRNGSDRNGSDRFDRTDRRQDTQGFRDRGGRGGELSAPNDRMPENAPRPRTDVQRGRDRQEAGTTNGDFRRGRMESPRDRRSSEQPSFDSRDSRPSGSRDDARESGRERTQARPDEGRMFRGVRDRDNGARMQPRSTPPQRERASERGSRDRSSNRGHGSERPQRGGQPQERKHRNDKND